MKSRLLPTAAVLCLSIVVPGARPGSAQELVTPQPEWLSRMLEEGWREVQEGVLQREVGEGRLETFTYGKEGLRWTVQRLEERVGALEREQASHPSAELAGILANLKGDLAEGQASLNAAGPEPSGGGELASGCEPSLVARASADPLSGTQAPGVTASADASFHSPCSDLGNTYSYAYARATAGTTMTVRSQENPKNNGTSLDSTASAAVSGALDCYSEGYARAWSPALGLSYEASDTNFSCQALPTDQTPFRGMPFAVPGTIKAADFDNGGEGIAYHEATPGSGSSYRTTGVDLWDDNVVYPESGEWLEYTIDVETAGTYVLVAQVTAESSGGSFHVELDGVDVTGLLPVPATGSRSTWGSVIKAGVSFPAGRHVMRVAVDASFDSLYSLRIAAAQAPFGGTPRTLPGTLRAADFDEGGEQVSYHDITAGCRGACDLRTADVDRWEHIVYDLGTGEWMEYTVDVTAAGTYTLAARVSAVEGGATFHVEFDGLDVTGPLVIPTTGAWNAFQTITRTGVSLSAGRKVMRIVVDQGAANIACGSLDTISLQP